MLAKFLSRLVAPAPALHQDAQARLAFAALLVRVARADGSYSDDERRGIEAILARRHGLSSAEAAELCQAGEALEASAADSVRFTRILKDAVPLDVRIGIVEALWEVALADGVRSNDEALTLRLMTNLLGITDLESALARQRVEARLG
jgi:uncharacterized tellurite resistance protein B-like protein